MSDDPHRLERWEHEQALIREAASAPPDTPTPTGEGMDLAAIQSRCDAATPGPWHWTDTGDVRMLCGPEGEALYQEPTGHSVSGSWPIGEARDADDELVANARTDIPALLSHLTALTAERDGYREGQSACYKRLFRIAQALGLTDADAHRVEEAVLPAIAALQAERDALTARVAEARTAQRAEDVRLLQERETPKIIPASAAMPVQVWEREPLASMWLAKQPLCQLEARS